MKKIIIALFIVVFHSVTSFSQWNQSISLTVPFSAESSRANLISENVILHCYSYPQGSHQKNISIYSSIDGGKNWKSKWNTSVFGGGGATEVYAVPRQQTFYAIVNVGGYDAILKTNDTGDTWKTLETDAGSGFHQDFFALDTSHFFYLHNKDGIHTYLHKYANGVNTFKVATFPSQTRNMFFTSPSEGYVVSTVYDSSFIKFKTEIYKTSTGGINWKTVFSDNSIWNTSIFFPSASTGYVVGASGKMMKTSDGGISWETLTSNTLLNLNDVYFINDSVGSVTADSGLIIHTTNGGKTWKQQTTGTKESFHKLLFLNDSIGFAFGGSIYKINQNHPDEILENTQSTKKDFMLYPNPGNGRFMIQSDFQIRSIEVFDMLGSRVYFEQTAHSEVNLQGRTKGVYFVKVTYADDTFSTQRLLISQ